MLILKEPAAVTSTYEVLEPETWVDKELPILEHIDIGDQLKEGNWLVVLYHHDCPACAEALPRIEEMARELEGNEEFLRFALVEVPPYGDEQTCLYDNISSGKLDISKEWFIETPVFVFIKNQTVERIWIKNCPSLNEIVSLVYF